MLSFVYQEMINLIVRLPIRRSPSVFMNAATWEYRTLDNSIFDVAKYTTLKQLSLLIPLMIRIYLPSILIFMQYIGN